MSSFLHKIIGKVRQLRRKRYNMFEDPAEQYYGKQYLAVINKHLGSSAELLEIGCQYGRFTIPLIRQGHRVLATDIREEYFTYIKNVLGTTDAISFSLEDIHQTIEQRDLQEFDVILCLELLYTLPDHREILQKIASKMKKGALLITSHRSIGYYVYRYAREKKWEELNQLLQERHPVFNAQSVEELQSIYETSGFKVNEHHPVGILSGFGADPFSPLADPSKMDETELQQLSKLESDENLQSFFRNNARYNLIIATPK